MFIDGIAVGQDLAVDSTGAWQSWRTLTLSNLKLPAGPHILKLLGVKGGFNLNTLTFRAGDQAGATSLREPVREMGQPEGSRAKPALKVDGVYRNRSPVSSLSERPAHRSGEASDNATRRGPPESRGQAQLSSCPPAAV